MKTFFSVIESAIKVNYANISIEKIILCIKNVYCGIILSYEKLKNLRDENILLFYIVFFAFLMSEGI
ncbi:MAG: hypothetical protein A2W91_01195 [Bacteroidetes bacterium GWF2_38_335]|nr:MAG: hypothetical protein A2W91_01195 [Bacteroidetes bacterium GWF2_38_335]